MSSCFHQHIHCLFERTSHKSSSVLPVDTVPSDGHEMAFGCHNVTQHRQVSIVHVDTVEGEDHVHFLFHRLPHRLDAKTLENLANIVTARSDRIHITFSQNLHKSCSVSLENPLGNSLEFSGICQHNSLLVIRTWEMHVHFTDRLQPLQSHVA